MATISSTIELYDAFSSPFYNIIGAVNQGIPTFENMQATMNRPVDVSYMTGVQNAYEETTNSVNQLGEAMQNVSSPTIDLSENEQKIAVIQGKLSELQQMQHSINSVAKNCYILPEDTTQDITGINRQLQQTETALQFIKSNPFDLDADIAQLQIESINNTLSEIETKQQNIDNYMGGYATHITQAASEQNVLNNNVDSMQGHIIDNTTQQDIFNREIEEGTDNASQLKSMIMGAVGAYMGFAGIRKVKGWIDECTEAFNIQYNAESQLMGVLANMLDADYVAEFEIDVTADTTAAELALDSAFNNITSKAAEIQSQGIYTDEAMIAAGAEFATYFTDTDAITTMMDTLSDYAMGMSGGGEIDTTSMVDYATNLGKIMSGSYDAMTKKGFEFTDAQKAVIEGTATEAELLEVVGDNYADMSEDMRAAAAISQVIDESWAGLYETMSNSPEGKIIQMNNAWSDMQEIIGGQLYPYVLLFVDAINNNWDTIEAVIQGFTTALEIALGVLSWIANGALSVAGVIVDNWSFIAPIIGGITSALAIYYGWQLLCKGASLVMTTAQWLLNAAMYACPITWIVIGVIALVTAFYLVIAAINKFAGTSISATGLVCGAIATAGAFIWNIFATVVNFVIDAFVGLWNFIGIFANFLGNVFINPVGAIAHLFEDIFDFILSIIQSVASAIDTVFGSNLAGAVSGFRETAKAWTDEKFGENEVFFEQIDASQYHLDRIQYSSAWNAGYNLGESVANFDPSSLFGTTDIPSPEDYASELASSLSDMGGLDGIGSDVGNIADNTDNIADAVLSDEELELLRNISERESINKFTTAEIKFDMINNNSLKSDMDIDGFIDKVTEQFRTALTVAAEGVHA